MQSDWKAKILNQSLSKADIFDHNIEAIRTAGSNADSRVCEGNFCCLID